VTRSVCIAPSCPCTCPPSNQRQTRRLPPAPQTPRGRYESTITPHMRNTKHARQPRSCLCLLCWQQLSKTCGHQSACTAAAVSALAEPPTRWCTASSTSTSLLIRSSAANFTSKHLCCGNQVATSPYCRPHQQQWPLHALQAPMNPLVDLLSNQGARPTSATKMAWQQVPLSATTGCL
jgi:hypothetical protein